jgi:nicotinic acid phosphoribosyltransferase
MWEVPLLALASELTFVADTTNLKRKTGKLVEDYAFAQGAKAMFVGECKFSKFGIRHRRSFGIQDTVVR